MHPKLCAIAATALSTICLAASPTVVFSQSSSDDLASLVKENLTGLSEREKRSVVLCVRGTISTNFRDTVAHNLRAGGEAAAWALKVNATENTLMSDLATEAAWTGLATYYKLEADATVRLIRGSLSADRYKLEARKNSVALKAELEQESPSIEEHKLNFIKFGSECKSISTGIIFLAKSSASAK